MQSGRPMVTRTANGHRELALNALQPYRSSLFWNWWYEDIYVGTPTQTRLHHHQQSTVRQRPLVMLARRVDINFISQVFLSLRSALVGL